MFVVGICVGESSKFELLTRPSLEAHAPDAHVIVRRKQTSIFSAYNSILEEASALQGVEGVILIHDDVELLGALDSVLRAEFSDPSVAIVGAIGGRGVQSVRWSRSKERFGHAPDAFYGVNDYGGGFHDVDIVDGFILAMSPWSVANLRFDERTFSGFHAYDADICMQARARGRRVRVADLAVFHHTKGGFGDVRSHRKADDRFRKKWGIPKDPMLYRLRRRRNRSPY